MQSKLLNYTLLSLTTAMVLGMTGCSSDSSSSPVTKTPTDNTNGDTTLNTYAGALSLSGSVEQNSLTKAPSLNRSIGFKADAPSSSSDEIVKLYVLDKNGDMKDTNITCPVDATTHAYTCSDIAGENQYIVRYIKNLGNGRVFEMKTNVAVQTTNVEEAPISKITTLITDSISKAVEQAIVSLTSATEDVVAELIARVKEAVQTSISQLIQNGTISIPDDSTLIVEIKEGESFDDYVGQKKLEENTKLSESSGAVLSDDSVTNILDRSKNEAKLGEYATMSHQDIIKEIFGHEDDIPTWIVEFLAAKYEHTFSIGGDDGLNSKIVFESEMLDDAGNIKTDNWEVKNLEKAGVNVDSALINSLLTAINNSVNDGTLLTNFKNELSSYKSLREKTTLTPEETKKLADFPPIIGYLFNDTFNGTSFSNVGQVLVYILYAEDIHVKSILRTQLANQNLTDGQIENLEIAEFEPEFIFKELGLDPENPESLAQIAQYNTPEVNYFEIQTQSTWNENGQTEFATFYAGLTKASWMFSDFTFEPSKLTSLSITYPTGTTTATKDINVSKLRIENNGDGLSLGYNPWNMNCEDNQPCEPDPSMMSIRDNTSGEYTINAVYDGETFTKSFDRFVLQNAYSYTPVLTSPLARPEWPQELNNVQDYSNLTTQQEAAQTAFNKENEAFMQATNNNGYMSFGTNNDAENALENLQIKWDDSLIKEKLATQNLPANIIPAYEVGVSLFEPKDMNEDGNIDHEDTQMCYSNWEECNVEIFNTWWDNRPIRTTSFIIPQSLPINSDQGRYQVHVNLVFIDKNTGHQIAHAGHTYTEFKVGTVGQFDGSETITFSGSTKVQEGAQMPSDLKVGFIKENCTYNADTFVYTCETQTLDIATPDSSGAYSLEVNASAIKAELNNGVNFNIVAFSDTNNNNQWDAWKPEMGNPDVADTSEISWWIDGKHFWFESWGEFRVSTNTWDENGTSTTESVVVPAEPNANVSIENMDINIWSYYNPDYTPEDPSFDPDKPEYQNPGIGTPTDAPASLDGLVFYSAFKDCQDDTCTTEITTVEKITFSATTLTWEEVYRSDSASFESGVDNYTKNGNILSITEDPGTAFEETLEVEILGVYTNGVEIQGTELEGTQTFTFKEFLFNTQEDALAQANINAI